MSLKRWKSNSQYSWKKCSTSYQRNEKWIEILYQLSQKDRRWENYAAEDVDRKEPLYASGRDVNCTLGHKVGIAVWRFPKNLRSATWPGCTTPGCLLKDAKSTGRRDVCTCTFIAVLYTIVLLRNHPRCAATRQKTVSYTYTVESF